MDSINYTTHPVYNPLASIEAKNKTSTIYFIDRWGTVYDRNPNLPEKKEEEAPKEEPSSLWREGDRK